MPVGINKGAVRRMRKTWALIFWIASGSVTFVVCGRILWLAYTTHMIFMPARRAAGRFVTLEQEPGFFWAAVTLYVIAFLCSPVGVATWTGDLIEQLRARRRRLRERQR